MDTDDQSSQPGTLLAAAREAAGLSVDDVSQRLKLSARQVSDIEANQFDNLGLAFSRGFIRSYARLLNLDANQLVARLPSGGHPHDQPLSMVNEQIPLNHQYPRLWLWLALAGLLILLAAPWLAYHWMSSPSVHPVISKPQHPVTHAIPHVIPTAQAPVSPASTAALPVAPTPVADHTVAADKAASSNTAGPATTTSVAPSQPAIDIHNTTSTKTIDTPPADTPMTESAASSSSATTNHLQLGFTEDAWISIHDAEHHRVVSRIFHAGETARFDVNGAVSLIIGNAAHVSLMFNGNPVNLAPWTPGKVARLTLPLN